MKFKSIEILYDPNTVYEKLKNNETSWGKDFLFLGLLILIIAFLFIPISDKFLINNVLGQGVSGQSELNKIIFKKILRLTIILEPFVFLLKNVLAAVLLYGGILLYKGKCKFKALFVLTLA